MPDAKNARKSWCGSSQQFSASAGLYSPSYLAALDWLSSLSWSGAGSVWLFKTILASLYGMAFLFTVTAILLVAPYIETKYFPVVSKMRIDQIIYDGPNRTIIYASFTKRRDCDYIGMAWFHGKRATGFTRAALQLMRDPSDISSSPNRPLGRQSSGPWIVGIPFGDIRDNSFVELYHHCTPLWITTTEFYP